MRAVTLASLFIAATLGCSATSTHQFTSTTGAGGNGTGASGVGGGGLSSTTSGGLGGSFAAGVGSGASTGSGTPGCSQAAELVYVLGEDNAIWSFDPPSKQFTELFTLNCKPPSDGNTWAPNSMAIDRNVVAWVNYVGTSAAGTDKAGVVFKVDINSKTCEPTPAVTMTNSQWYRLGMGFSTDTAGGTSETLYVTGTGTTGGSNSPGLGKIDVTTGALTPIAQFGKDATLSGQSAELTGTGDARLFGYFTTSPNVRVAQIDPTTANIVSDQVLAGVGPPLAWAFSFWGGSFYLYASNGIAKSHVIHYDPSTQAVDTAYVPNAGIIIVGAGVSTCAPIKPPT